MEVQVLNFGGNTNVAYDLYQNTEPKRRPLELPEELPREEAAQPQRAVRTFAPFSVFGIALCFVMIMLVVFGNVQFYEAKSRAAELKSQLYSLQQTQTQLMSKYESRIDLREIEKRANELGLTTPRSEQIIYLDLSGEDNAEIYHEKTTSMFVEVVQAVEQSVAELIAYLNPNAA